MNPTERDFESHIEFRLVAAGYRVRLPEQFDPTLCLDAETLFEFLKASQPGTWSKLEKQHGDRASEKFLKRLTSVIEDKGVLHVLRRGVNDVGCDFQLAYYAPETTLNADHQRLYRMNIFSIIRQVRYSKLNENSIDMVLFLNGLPLFTMELKNPAKGQTVEHAQKQYMQDRNPKEPLLSFRRCLAHFAVDTDAVYITTHLKGNSTRFLPFNKGYQQGAGNPPNPDGYRTEYLWDDVLSPDSVLNVVSQFLRVVDEYDDDGKKTGKDIQIFPRFHQLTTVRALAEHAKETGPGNNYLIEHSAGSGKSNTISWLAHQLTGLHNVNNERVFDSIIVITDRRILDRQLKQTVVSFEQQKGIVSAIDGRKAMELANALSEGADIIVTTVQTFPFVTEKITEMAGKRFAVLIDEAHSGQTGETAKSVKATLAAPDLETAETADGTTDADDEDKTNEQVEAIMRKHGRLKNVSFFAFTATPKNKTLELFGSRRADGAYAPFSLYSMKQAIEEGFILDVLKNYTTFETYFALNKRIEDDPKYSKKKAVGLLKQFVSLHPHAIQRKAEIMLEHFEKHVMGQIDGLAKAMIVTRSRLHAVRYKKVFDKLLVNKRYKALVAFSGVVKDPDDQREYTEQGMNGVPEKQTAQTFKKSTYRLMIVAEKFQTGFDQPLLQTMYVDKILGGVSAVQTLSRLNRMHPGKTETSVIDFANASDAIQKAFQPYYETTILTEATDPNKLYDLKQIVEDFGIYYKQDVESFAKAYFSTRATQEGCRAVLDPVAERFRSLVDDEGQEDKDKKLEIRSAMLNYIRLYGFLSHIITFTDSELEKSYQFMRMLRPLLTYTQERLPVDILEKVNMSSYRPSRISTGDIALLDENGELKPASEIGTKRGSDDDRQPLSDIISYMNESYGADFTDEDKVRYFTSNMEQRLSEHQGLRQAMNPDTNPSEDNRRQAFDDHFNTILDDMIESDSGIYRVMLQDEKLHNMIRLVLYRNVVKSLTKSLRDE